MSRLKLFLFVLIIVILGVVFIQNREPLALKILCPDTQSCVYQTPQLPLAVWIGLFTLGGMITSMLGQVLNRYRYSGSGKRRYTSGDLEAESRGWSSRERNEPQDDYYRDDRPIRDSNTSVYVPTGYEKPQEAEKVERSGSTYSYKYKDKKGDANNIGKTSIESETKSDINLDKDDDEDWI